MTSQNRTFLGAPSEWPWKSQEHNLAHRPICCMQQSTATVGGIEWAKISRMMITWAHPQNQSLELESTDHMNLGNEHPNTKLCALGAANPKSVLYSLVLCDYCNTFYNPLLRTPKDYWRWISHLSERIEAKLISFNPKRSNKFWAPLFMDFESYLVFYKRKVKCHESL